MTSEPTPPRVDLTQFESVEDAIEKVAAAGDYDEVARHFLSQEGIDAIALPVLFFSSMVNRCNSLHAAIAREMHEQNPHAVFPLIRAYAEGAALLIYVRDHIGYIEALIARVTSGQLRRGCSHRELRICWEMHARTDSTCVCCSIKAATPGLRHERSQYLAVACCTLCGRLCSCGDEVCGA